MEVHRYRDADHTSTDRLSSIAIWFCCKTWIALTGVVTHCVDTFSINTWVSAHCTFICVCKEKSNMRCRQHWTMCVWNLKRAFKTNEIMGKSSKCLWAVPNLWKCISAKKGCGPLSGHQTNQPWHTSSESSVNPGSHSAWQLNVPRRFWQTSPAAQDVAGSVHSLASWIETFDTGCCVTF